MRSGWRIEKGPASAESAAIGNPVCTCASISIVSPATPALGDRRVSSSPYRLESFQCKLALDSWREAGEDVEKVVDLAVACHSVGQLRVLHEPAPERARGVCQVRAVLLLPQGLRKRAAGAGLRDGRALVG